MNGEAVNTGKKGSGLAKFLYVVAAVLAVIFVYMLIVNIMYISSYAASYGMSFSDMWQEAVQYIVTGSVSYFVYTVLVFAAGKIVSIVQTGCCVPCAPQVGEETCCDENFEETEDADVEADDVKAEGFDPDQVINRLGKKEEAEEKADDEAEPEMQPEDEPDEPEITVVPIRERRKRRFIK